MIENMDWENWSSGMSPDEAHKDSIDPVTRPRPGHADLPGATKYNQKDLRNILERSSARETAIRVALGAVAKKFLEKFGIRIGSYVAAIGSESIDTTTVDADEKKFLELFRHAETSAVRCPDKKTSDNMVKSIDEAKAEGYSLGGVFMVFAVGLPVGLGSHIQWDKRLDGMIAQAVMSIQAIKGVEIGSGFEMARRRGSEVMDELLSRGESGEFLRKSNHAGGIEGGITNGMPLVVRAAMKPIPTQAKPLRSVDIKTKEQVRAAYERSDVCAVPAAGVIGEAMVALILADVFLDKFGGDSIGETAGNFASYLSYVKGF
jgi:chorismate synthase